MRPVSVNWVNHHAVRAPVVDLEEPEGATKWGFVSGCMAGLRHRHDSLPKSKESQIRALEKGRHQHSSSLTNLVGILAFERPNPANGGKYRLGLIAPLKNRVTFEQQSHVPQLAPQCFR